MSEQESGGEVWIVHFTELDEDTFQPCNLNVFLSEKAALDFSKKEMRKRWTGSDEAVGCTAAERNYLIATAVEEMKNGEEAQVSDHRWTMTRLTAQY